MEPLLALNPVQLTPPPSRPVAEGEAESRPRSDAKPVELRSDRIESAEDAQVRSEADSDRPLPPPGDGAAVPPPEQRTVQYSVVADRIQTRVVDRETDATVRAVPTDDKLELVQSFRAYVGQSIDLYA